MKWSAALHLVLGLRAISTSSFKRPASKHSSSAPPCARCMEGSLVEEEEGEEEEDDEADVEANRIFVHYDSNSAS